jgi:hypothetical protein
MSDPDYEDETPQPSLCDGDTTDNYWFEQGVCMLDQMDRSQVTYALERVEKARIDLKRVTTNQELHDLVDNVPMLRKTTESDEAMKMNKSTLPYYTIFRGNLNNM